MQESSSRTKYPSLSHISTCTEAVDFCSLVTTSLILAQGRSCRAATPRSRCNSLSRYFSRYKPPRVYGTDAIILQGSPGKNGLISWTQDATQSQTLAVQGQGTFGDVLQGRVRPTKKLRIRAESFRLGRLDCWSTITKRVARFSPTEFCSMRTLAEVAAHCYISARELPSTLSVYIHSTMESVPLQHLLADQQATRIVFARGASRLSEQSQLALYSTCLPNSAKSKLLEALSNCGRQMGYIQIGDLTEY